MRGGLSLIAHKEQSTGLAIDLVAPPKIASLLLAAQNLPAQILVQAGDDVRVGQTLAHTHTTRLHASVSGRIADIRNDNGQYTFVIAGDDADRRDDSVRPIGDFSSMEVEALRTRIALAGITGLGGA
ncbi:MAG TPA: hypothetical protein VK629_10825, partial [Steroidobacteraceae bacterium]|nr:hypothetical protein [Steroidobacteraceae bacterium]